MEKGLGTVMNQVNPRDCHQVQADDRVDILLASYNGAQYIGEQIESIIGQTYGNWRLLVSDDGSTDDTVAIVQAYASQDPRIVLVESRNTMGTAAGNFFGLLTYVESDYAMFCDQDDVWDADKVEISLKAMHHLEEEHGRADDPLLVFTDSRVVNSNLEVVDPSFVDTLGWDPLRVTLPQLIYGNVAQGCAILLNRSLANLMEEKAFASEPFLHDWFAAVLAKAFGDIFFVKRATMSYRQHEGNVVGTKEQADFWTWFRNFFGRKNPFHTSISDSKEIEMKAINRARYFLKEMDNLPDCSKDALSAIGKLPGSSLRFKFGVYRKYNLLNSSVRLRNKIYRIVGLLAV